MNKYKFILFGAAVVTLPIYASSNYADIPRLVKLIFALMIWYGLATAILSPSKNKSKKFYYRITIIIFILALISMIRAAVMPYYGQGNKWLTLFGNDYTSLLLFAPLFSWISTCNGTIQGLKSSAIFLMIVGFVLLFLGAYPYKILFIITPFFVFLPKQYRIVAILCFMAVIYCGLFTEETSRTGLLVAVIVLLAYLFVRVIKRKVLVKVLCLSLMILPIVFSIVTMIVDEYSILEYVMPVVGSYYDNDAMTMDSRTFIFKEMALDLTNENAWLFGKGALSHYYSSYFANASNDVADRLNCEVTLLELLLRGGIVYVVTYYSLIIAAVIYALRKAKNSFVLFICVVASGWVLVSCISDLSGCSYFQIGFFVLLGICFSDTWLNYSDDDISRALARKA